MTGRFLQFLTLLALTSHVAAAEPPSIEFRLPKKDRNRLRSGSILIANTPHKANYTEALRLLRIPIRLIREDQSRSN